MKYCVIKIGAEIGYKELKKALEDKDISQYAAELTSFLLKDENLDGDIVKEFTNKEEAMAYAKEVNDGGSCRYYSGNRSYFLVECAIVESYETDEDGEFLSGSCYDYEEPLFSDEQLEYIKSIL